MAHLSTGPFHTPPHKVIPKPRPSPYEIRITPEGSRFRWRIHYHGYAVRAGLSVTYFQANWEAMGEEALMLRMNLLLTNARR